MAESRGELSLSVVSVSLACVWILLANGGCPKGAASLLREKVDVSSCPGTPPVVWGYLELRRYLYNSAGYGCNYLRTSAAY